MTRDELREKITRMICLCFNGNKGIGDTADEIIALLPQSEPVKTSSTAEIHFLHRNAITLKNACHQLLEQADECEAMVAAVRHTDDRWSMIATTGLTSGSLSMAALFLLRECTKMALGDEDA